MRCGTLDEIIHQRGTWITTLIPIALLIGLEAQIGARWTRRRDREEWPADPTFGDRPSPQGMLSRSKVRRLP